MASTSHPPPADALLLLRSAQAKAEAAWAVLADRRCSPGDAVPLLDLGWRRLAAGLGKAAAGEKPFAGLAEGLAGTRASERPRIAAALDRLSAAAASVAQRDPDLSRGELELLASALATSAGSALRSLAPRSLARTVLRRAPAAVAALAFLGAVAAVAFPRHAPEHGWRGTYFKKDNLTGETRVQRDPAVAFFWDEGPPISGFPADHFSARWDGCLRVDRDGVARFALGSDDGSRLFVDGRKLIDAWQPHSMTFSAATMPLEKGTHWMRVEYQEQSGTASVLLKLGWDGQEPRPLDSWSVLYPGASETAPCASLN